MKWQSVCTSIACSSLTRHTQYHNVQTPPVCVISHQFCAHEHFQVSLGRNWSLHSATCTLQQNLPQPTCKPLYHYVLTGCVTDGTWLDGNVRSRSTGVAWLLARGCCSRLPRLPLLLGVAVLGGVSIISKLWLQEITLLRIAAHYQILHSAQNDNQPHLVLEAMFLASGNPSTIPVPSPIS